MMNNPGILIYGYGNPGRQDDGLGPAFVERMQKWNMGDNHINIQTESDYQLNIEDSLLISEMDVVIFVDASKSGPEFRLKKIKKRKKSYVSTHYISPEVLMYLCGNLYCKTPVAYILAIRGYKWDVGENISAKANANLEKSITFMTGLLGMNNGE